MHLNEIDEIIKRSLQDSERKSNDFAMEAKLRIWEAIEKPKKKSGLYWGLVLAMAAAVSFFLISTFLFFKLQSKQEELFALQQIGNQQPAMANLPIESIIQDENFQEEKIPEFMGKQFNEVKKGQLIADENRKNLNQVMEEKAWEPLPEISLHSQMVVENPEPEIVFPEMGTTESAAKLISPQEIETENPVESNPKSQKKLRLRFGNKNQNFNSGNSLALKIKL